jgi:hypothetical protein
MAESQDFGFGSFLVVEAVTDIYAKDSVNISLSVDFSAPDLRLLRVSHVFSITLPLKRLGDLILF